METVSLAVNPILVDPYRARKRGTEPLLTPLLPFGGFVVVVSMFTTITRSTPAASSS